jgi:acyl transferase domain-containing protein
VFKLARNEAAVVDPQQRLLLEGCLTAWIEAAPTVQGIDGISVGAIR